MLWKMHYSAQFKKNKLNKKIKQFSFVHYWILLVDTLNKLLLCLVLRQFSFSKSAQI